MYITGTRYVPSEEIEKHINFLKEQGLTTNQVNSVLDYLLRALYGFTDQLDDSVHFSKTERLILSNQLKILEKVNPEEQREYANHREALERGYKLHYRWLFNFFDEEMSEEESEEVLEVLNMYRAITFSYREIESTTEIPKKAIRFPGFDGNNETNQYAYTQYFIVDLGRFQELIPDGHDYPDFNSHSPMLDTYREMLNLWNKKDPRSKYALDEDYLRKLLEAGHRI